MRRLILSTLFVVASAFSVVASPHGLWPDEARDHALPRPGWVLVVPAMRLDDGTIKVWSRLDDWPQEWVVPRATPSGLRTIAISGDSEDQKLISPFELDNMRMDSIRLMVRKYGADAVAVAVVDTEGRVAVAAWAKGGQATWSEDDRTGAPREAALGLIDSIFSGAVGVTSEDPEVDEGFDGRVEVLAQRMSEDGVRMEYRLGIPDDAADVLLSVGGITVTRTGDGTTDVVVDDGREIGDVLREAGLNPDPVGDLR